jgi:hypothetical protein
LYYWFLQIYEERSKLKYTFTIKILGATDIYFLVIA